MNGGDRDPARMSVMNIIIPAYNEALVIERCLASLFAQSCPLPLRIVVVANGCVDATAAIARRMIPHARACGGELIVVESERGGKAWALNVGDQYVGPGPRIYLDADVAVGPGALAAIAAALASGVQLCAPAIRVGRARTMVTRGYGTVWSRLPVVRSDVIGCGLYAVSAEGRARWGGFPPIISDDKFVRLQFEPGERRVLEDVYFEIQMPEGLRELTMVRGRWCRGNRELEAKFPAIVSRDRRLRRATLKTFANPQLWPWLPLFLMIFMLGEMAALRRRGIGAAMWERAIGAREVATQQAETFAAVISSG